MRCTNLLEQPSTWRIRDMDFSSPSSSSGDRMSKNQMMNEVRNQVAMATAQELIQVSLLYFKYSGHVYSSLLRSVGTRRL